MVSMGHIVKEQAQISRVSNELGKKISEAIVSLSQNATALKESVSKFKVA